MNTDEIMTAMWKQFLAFLACNGDKLDGLSQAEVAALYEKYKRGTRS